MIRFNIDGATLVDVGSWEDIFDRPDFRAPIDPSTYEITDMIGQYSLPTKRPCGLKNCRTLHQRGYVVKIGNKGYVTNIGHICGKSHYKLDFDQAKKRFDAAVNAQRFRENVSAKQNQVPELLDRIDLLLDEESQNRYQEMHKFMTRTLDERASRALQRKARQNDNLITRAVRLSEDEREFELGLRSEARFRDETVLTMSGVAAAATYSKLSPTKLRSLRSEIEAFADLEVESLGYVDLKKSNNWANRIDKRIDDLEAAAMDCVRFLLADNRTGILKHKHFLR